MQRFFLLGLCTLLVSVGSSVEAAVRYAVIISANAEWKAVRQHYPHENFETSPWGEFFEKSIQQQKVLFFHEGWGKVAAAGATQYVIDRFQPEVLINLGTCGGFEGRIRRQETVLATRTIIYDILEAMGDSKQAIADYSVTIELGWLKGKLPVEVIKAPLVSADRDLRPDQISWLVKEFDAPAGDWESGAIAYTAMKNRKKVVILRTVTDLVNQVGGEAYGNLELYQTQTDTAMFKLLDELPLWISYLEKIRL